MQVTSDGVTDLGTVRTDNEDRFCIEKDLGLYIVCDGMGGRAGGEIAASMAITLIVEHFRQRDANAARDASPAFATTATSAIQRASQEIHSRATQESELSGMGTTVSMLVLQDHRACIANVGDSRTYLIRAGDSRLLTTDQTIRNELLSQGYSPDDPLLRGRFSRMLTHCVGEGKSVNVEVTEIAIQPGDRFLLCTDGLSCCFQDDHEVARVAGYGPPATVTESLVSFAKERDSSDNITAVLVVILA